MRQPIEYDTAFLWAFIAFAVGLLIGMMSPIRFVIT